MAAAIARAATVILAARVGTATRGRPRRGRPRRRGERLAATAAMAAVERECFPGQQPRQG
eukprot:5042215-Lingulodinium_polyedra.AAC.1